jgi:hypothetical protein
MRPGRPLADPSAVQPEDDAGGDAEIVL